MHVADDLRKSPRVRRFRPAFALAALAVAGWGGITGANEPQVRTLPVGTPGPTAPRIDDFQGRAYFPQWYNTSSCLYGYVDYTYGRGPLPNLGGAALSPGFQGYGVFCSPGYGLGTMPSTRKDLGRPGILRKLANHGYSSYP